MWIICVHSIQKRNSSSGEEEFPKELLQDVGIDVTMVVMKNCTDEVGGISRFISCPGHKPGVNGSTGNMIYVGYVAFRSHSTC